MPVESHFLPSVFLQRAIQTSQVRLGWRCAQGRKYRAKQNLSTEPFLTRFPWSWHHRIPKTKHSEPTCTLCPSVYAP